ncbi:D-Tyr tRNAtyr deacylase-like domain-containing protein, partial [Chytridium lagenaria]
MKAVIQRVETVSSIGRGLCSRFHTTDISNGISKPWSKSVMDCGMEVLCVSQFTLYALTTKGSKPDFHLAMKSDEAKTSMMQVNIVNDGPVTIL